MCIPKSDSSMIMIKLGSGYWRTYSRPPNIRSESAILRYRIYILEHLNSDEASHFINERNSETLPCVSVIYELLPSHL